jgi:hypothetical protein
MKPRSSEMLLRGRTVCWISLVVVTLVFAQQLPGQGMSQGPPPPATAKAIQCKARPIPQLEDITDRAGIRFEHDFSPEAHSILESMAGGVLLLDYDRDGWLDIYFTNAPTVEEALQGKKARGALYHNNHDGTFTDATEKAGIGKPCHAMGGAVGDYNNDGWPDIYVTCYGGNVLYRNNGDGTFTDVTKQAGVADGRWFRRLRRRRLARPDGHQLCRSRPSPPSRVRQRHDLSVHGNQRAMWSTRPEGLR